MRRRNLVAWIVLAVALLLGTIGRKVGSNALYLLSGLGFLVAVGLWVSMAPAWQRLRGRVPAMPGLFPRVDGEWDPVQGAPAAALRRRRLGRK